MLLRLNRGRRPEVLQEILSSDEAGLGDEHDVEELLSCWARARQRGGGRREASCSSVAAGRTRRRARKVELRRIGSGKGGGWLGGSGRGYPEEDLENGGGRRDTSPRF